jgi:iron complex transport system substrate-binding protein
VLYLIGVEPMVTVGPGTFIHELVELAGGRNGFADLTQRWPQVALEEVVRRDADVIVIGSEEASRLGAAQLLASRPGWRDLSAVRAGRVYSVDASVFNRPGPSAGPAATMLARLLHPDAFTEASR